MAENTSTYTLNLDAEQFTSAANKAAGALTSIGEAGESIHVLIETLEHIGFALGIVTVAFLALEKTFEAVFDSERIAATENQFKILSSSAGVYSETLLKGLTEASNGWATQAELMTHANKSMTELEAGVDKLPNLMEAAKKATAVMGGDFLQNFDAMSQAVATGNTRGLRHLGIIVDQQKAYRDYAASIGATVDTLSLAGKQEAIMNAVLAQSSEKFKGQGEQLTKSINLWQQTKVIFSEISEGLVVLIGHFASPAVINFFTMLKNGAQDFKNVMFATFEHGEKKVEGLENKLKSLRTELGEAEKAQKSAMGGDAVLMAGLRVTALTKRIKEYESALEKTKTTDQTYLAQEKQRHAQEIAMGGEKISKSKTVNEAVLKQRAEFNKELEGMDKERANLDRQIVAEEIKRVESVDQATKLEAKQRTAVAAETAQKIHEIGVKQQQLDAQLAARKITPEQQAAASRKLSNELVQLNRLKDLQMERDDVELQRMQEKALDNYVRHSKNAFDGIARSFEAMSKRNQMAMKNTATVGNMATDAFSSHSVSSIQEWAAGHKSATKAVEGMFAGMAGDMAIKYGTLMLLASVWPPNPIGLAGGTALIALGTMLQGMASGSSSIGSFGGGGGGSIGAGGGSLSSSSSSSSMPSAAATQTQQAASGVHITVQGSIFDTQATQTRIADLVRSAQDSTDFSIAKVGGGV